MVGYFNGNDKTLWVMVQGLVFGCAVFALVWCKGDVLSGLFTADAAVIANSYAYLSGAKPMR